MEVAFSPHPTSFLAAGVVVYSNDFCTLLLIALDKTFSCVSIKHMRQ